MRSSNRRPGRPCLLTPERVDAIVRAFAVGANTVLAAEAAGVSRATLARWIACGRAAAEARENGQPADPREDAFVDLYRRVELARAQMATRALARVLQAGAGSLVLEERVRAYTDPVTGLDVEERQVRYLRPDWRAAAWWLARFFPEHYGPNAKSFAQVLDEFTAQGLHDERDRAESAGLAGLAERLELALAGTAPGTELPAPVQSSTA
ncbi:hypothetical protein SAMN04490357_7701 [Streptomyces misionensis]|uniref:Uncharacterized protein n=1 Tax=Streptomyces misionensis TaxID=67331 RepID=A0A1H5K497_9ACTN|nr:hypothetical protein [Streptomyces misionensis]SEE59535.1 hypothetical protein SAMN04490357_7701 [Streptomyces misionensis]